MSHIKQNLNLEMFLQDVFVSNFLNKEADSIIPNKGSIGKRSSSRSYHLKITCASFYQAHFPGFGLLMDIFQTKIRPLFQTQNSKWHFPLKI